MCACSCRFSSECVNMRVRTHGMCLRQVDIYGYIDDMSYGCVNSSYSNAVYAYYIRNTYLTCWQMLDARCRALTDSRKSIHVRVCVCVCVCVCVRVHVCVCVGVEMVNGVKLYRCP